MEDVGKMVILVVHVIYQPRVHVGTLCFEENSYFFLSNTLKGASCNDKKGYRLSYILGPGIEEEMKSSQYEVDEMLIIENIF